MDINKKAMAIFAAMSEGEQIEFAKEFLPSLVLLMSRDEELQALVWSVLPSTTTVHKGPKAKGKGGGGKKPYWIKTYEGINEKMRGAARVNGNWVNDPSSLPAGTLVVYGAKWDGERMYGFGKTSAGDTANVHIGSKVITIAGIATSYESSDWSALEPMLLSR